MTIKPSIAVVEDDQSVRDATVGLLRSHGFLVKGFASPDEFLSSTRLHITTCLIADMRMPEMSGLALFGQLQAQGTPIPTVLITAFPEETVRSRALAAGVTAYLAKPFSEQELIDSIDLAARRGGAPSIKH